MIVMKILLISPENVVSVYITFLFLVHLYLLSTYIFSHYSLWKNSNIVKLKMYFHLFLSQVTEKLEQRSKTLVLLGISVYY